MVVSSASAVIVVSSAPAERYVFTGNALGLDRGADPTGPHLHSFWSNTPFVFWGLYLGGVNWCCHGGSPLSAGYISTITHGTYQHWSLAPIWVGPQDPCWPYSGDKFSTDTTDAYNSGWGTGYWAHHEALSLGMGNNVPLTDDLEAFNTNDQSCVDAARAFVHGWDDYVTYSGIYGSVGSPCPGGSDLPTYGSIYHPPGHIWGAHWDGNPNTYDMGGCLGNLWTRGQRLKQYLGPHDETWHGLTMNVDSDSVDGPVYRYPPDR
jgi:hypothetical protein